jgi:hypothetical protein
VESKRATKETGACIYCVATVMKANTHEIPISNLARRQAHAARPVSFLCLLRQVSSVLPRNRGNEPPRNQGEASFLAANSWQRNCMDSVAG